MGAIYTLLTLTFSTLTYIQVQPQLVASHWDKAVGVQAVSSRCDLLKISLLKLNFLMEIFQSMFVS